ncbi:hypothetical protein AB0M44_22060 [Streptosporangium subroseum]|uniref:hypothetical protein n=1 Tax=Streptosporangium subroseum TaxID=106412 RepID=UPI0034245CB5
MSNMLPAIIAAIAAIITVALTVVTTRKVSEGQRQATLTVADRQIENQRFLAREERHQKRLEAAYKELLSWVDDIRSWARKVQSACDQRHPLTDDAPDIPTHDHSVYWSQRVWQLLTPVTHLIVLMHHHGETAVTDEEWPQEFARDSAIRLTLDIQLNQVVQQVGMELQGSHDGQGVEVWDAVECSQQTIAQVDNYIERQLRVHREVASLKTRDLPKPVEHKRDISGIENNTKPSSNSSEQEQPASGGGTPTPG